VAQSWLVYRLTGSAALLGLITFTGQIPVLFLSPLGGVVADRRSRHRIILITQALSMALALGLAALTLTGAVRVWHLFVFAAMLGVVNSFDIPARQAFVVDMVEKGDLMNAIALNSSMVNGARIVGPAIAGLLVAAVGEGWCFFFNGASYVAVTIGLLMMRVPPRLPSQAPSSALEHVMEGFRFVASTRPVRALMLLLGLVSLMGMPYAVLMPILADKVLHGGASGLGILMGATGIGALFGAMTLAIREDVRGLGKWIAYTCAGFGVSLILFGESRSFWLSAIFLVFAGYSMMVQMAASNTLVQTMSPDELRGRVMAVYSMMFIGMAPFGALLAGALGDWIGAPETVMIGGFACILGAAVFALKLPRLQEEARPLLALSRE
jgi:MFS family permease